jgi:1-acyl-sn-glycerol-3-phosphate acyltransferase
MSKDKKPCTYFIRSSLFNLCFYSIVAMFCVILLPMLFMPRKIMMGAVYIFIYTTAFLEKYILGLTYEVRGAEHLPEKPPYIVAAKHQSAYETFKLHFLFDNPATILKKELLKIPLWGQYLKKSGVIAIDRSTPRSAIKSMKEGAKEVAAQNRPIVVFPQGTRVPPGIDTDQKPYKAGITRIQDATELPIIPMATNTGVFYPKNGWCKKPGRVVFEFLPPIEYAKNRKSTETIKILENTIEEKSNTLMNEAYESLSKRQPKHSLFKTATILLPLILVAYSGAWFYIANCLEKSYINWLVEIQSEPSIKRVQSTDLQISGFPGKIRASLPHLRIISHEGILDIIDIYAQGWPFPSSTIELQTGGISAKLNQWKSPVLFDFLRTDFNISNNRLNVHKAILERRGTRATLTGTAASPTPPNYPEINLDITITGYGLFLRELVDNSIIKRKPATMASMILKTLERPDGLHTNVISQGNIIFLGPLPIYKFPEYKMR